MHTPSASLSAPSRLLTLSGAITLLTGSVLTFSPDQAIGCTVSEGCADGRLLGGAFSAACTLTLDDRDGYFTHHHSLRGASVRVFLNAGEESLPLCAFIADRVSVRENGGCLTLSGSDALAAAFEGVFEDDLVYPQTLGSLAAALAARAGFTLAQDFPNASFSIPARPDWGEISLRQALSHVACAAGCFVRIGRDGALGFRPVWQSEAAYALPAAMTLRREYDGHLFGPLTGLSIACHRAPRGAAPLTVTAEGAPLSEDAALSVSGNPLFPYGGSHTQALAQALLQTLAGLRSVRLRLAWRGDPALAVGDRVRVTDSAGEVTEAVVTGQTLSFLQGFSMQTDCLLPTRPAAVGRLFTAGGALNAAMLQGSLDGVLIRDGTLAARAIVAGSITAAQLAAGSVTAEKIAAGAVDALALSAVQADILRLRSGLLYAGIAEIGKAQITTANIESAQIDWASITALTASAAGIAQAEIGSASIGYAQIKDASVQNLIARDAVTDRYFIDKLAVRSAQMVQATVGELVVKASDGRYYRLDVAADGSVSPTQVTPTAAEIAAGVTSDGHGAIIETDLTVAELSASNMKAINALIDKLTAGRIDVDTLFARQATVNRLLAMDITGNQYLRLMVKRTFSQWTDPAADPLISFVQDGDIWDRNSHIRTWNELGEFTWNRAAAYRWVDLEASDQFVRRNGEWTPMNLNTQARAVQAQMLLEQDALKLRVDSQETDIAGLKARVTTVETVYSEQGIRDIIATEFTEQIDGLIDDAAGEAIEKLLSTRLAFLQWEEPAGTEEDPLIDGMVWAKDHGYRTWNDVSAVPWAEMESCTWDSFLGPRFYVYKSGAWVLVTDYGRQVSETVRLDRTVEGVSANTERIARVGDHLSSLTAEFTVGFGEITARVTQVEADVDTKYTVRSGVDILPAGIEISGGKYVKIKSGGLFTVESGNFSIDGSGNVSLTGAITSQSGTIGGWTLEADKLSSGSGTNYVHVASGGTYAFLAGNATEASAPFRVKRDGTVYLTKLIALDENNQETNVNLRTAGLWKLGSANIKNASVSGSTLTIERYSGGDLTVNFNTAASVTLESAWSGSGREHTFTVTASNGQSAGAKLTLSTYGDDYTSFNASHKKQITVGATGIGHPGGSGLVYQFDVDASGVFLEGKGSVTLTVGAWTNGKAAVTASNGQTAEVSLPAFSASASAFLNHKSTVAFSTPSVQAALKTVTVDATEEYEAGVAAGEAEFTEYSGYTLYRVSNGNYRNLELFRRYTNPGGGYSYESVGSGYVQVTESGIPTLYQKTE